MAHGRPFDLDLAGATASKYCTGTTPFIALDLLRDRSRRHRLRFDLESALYVLYWLVVHHQPDGQTISREPLRDWYIGPSSEYLASMKAAWLREEKRLVKDVLVLEHHRDLLPGIGRLRTLFYRVEADIGATVRAFRENDQEYDYESVREASGVEKMVTADNLVKALRC